MTGVRLKIGGHYRIRRTTDQDVMAGRLQIKRYRYESSNGVGKHQNQHERLRSSIWTKKVKRKHRYRD